MRGVRRVRGRRRGRPLKGCRARGRHQLATAREALVTVFRHRARDDGVEAGGKIGTRGRHVRRGLGEVRVHDRNLTLARERHPAGETFVEHTAERVDVGSLVDALALDLLRSRVVDGADEDSRARQATRGRRLLDDAEVREEDVVGGLLDEDVRRLDVAVHEIAGVRGVERGGRLLEEVERAADAQRALPFQHRLEVGAPHVAHGDVQDPFGLARVVDRDDVRVVHLGCPPRLALEALAEIGVLAQGRGEELQSDFATEAEVLGEIHHAHAAAPEQRLEPVAGDGRSDPGARAHSFVICGIVLQGVPGGQRWCVAGAGRRGRATA